MRTAGMLARAALLCGLALALGSCSAGGPTSPDVDETALPTRSVSGTIELPDSSSLDPMSLEVLSFAGSAAVGANGAFSIRIPETDLPQVLAVVDAGRSPVLLGYAEAGEDQVLLDAGSTALALVLMNPFVTMFAPEDRATLVEAVRSKDWWPELVDWTESVVGRSAGGRLDEQLEPALTQLAAEIAIDVLNDWPAGALQSAGPWLVDADGGGIDVVNPDPIYYGARFLSASGDSLVALVGSDRDRVRVLPAWPPYVDVSGPTGTEVELGDGTFEVAMMRGDFTVLDPRTANGLASSRNMARGIVEALALASGVTVEPDPDALALEDADGGAIASRARSGDVYGLFAAFLSFIEGDPGRISTWFWGGRNVAAEDYVASVCPLLRAIAFSTEVMADGESRVPFYSRLAGVDPLPVRRIDQTEGVMVEEGANRPPRARFTAVPSFVEVGGTFGFDASATTDADGHPGEIQLRWDWENDGIWDTAWMTARSAVHAYAAPGAYEVALEARDAAGLTDTVVHTVNVGGGADSATHVVIFRDAVPWGPEIPSVLEEMLEVMGFAQGPGGEQYEIEPSSAMDTLGLVPGRDLVIIPGDQPQTFYDRYAANQVRMLRFVDSGGTMLWDACDRGPHGGSIAAAGIVLPGAIGLVPYETWYNYVEIPGAPLVEGLPQTIYGQYASHAGITNLPDGATSYLTDDAGRSTLVEFDYGEGWIVVTTQPLEWNFYNNWTSGSVLPHVICYVFDLPLVHDFGEIVKPEERGRPPKKGGDRAATSGIR